MREENILARYKVLHELGRGATGAVYAAQERETGATVALKRLDPALLGADRNLAARFLKQAHAARLLKHRNIVTIHDAGEAAGTAYVAMEMLEGESLRKILDAGPLPIARALQIAHDLACALAHAHLQGVVHGGLRPSNIFVLRSGVVKITDFGIGQAATSGARADCLRYMSPEQVRGEPVDHRSDIFALGALFYEMLTHRAAFEGDSAQQITENILHAEPPRPSELNPHVPPALDGIVSSMLAKQPAVRMPGAPVLQRELERLQEALGLGSDAKAAAEEPRAREQRPRRFVPREAESPAAEELQHRDRTGDRDGIDYLQAALMPEPERIPERPSSSWPAIFVALAIVVGLGAMYFSSSESERSIAANRVQEAPPTAAPAPPPTTPAPVAAVAKEPEKAKEPATTPAVQQASPPLAAAVVQAKQQPLDIPPAAKATPPERRVAQEPAPAPAAPAVKLPRTMPSTAKAPEQPGSTARLILAVSPRGEIYIDDKHHGITPPITTFDLEPGMHRVEVRSGSRRPYLTYITVQAGDVRRIRHDFNAKPIHPPR